MKTLVSITLIALALIARPAGTQAADYWVAPLDPAVVTNNDCGFISAASGAPTIRRSFQLGQDEKGAPAYAADRIHSGDELVSPVASRLEWVSGSNIVVALGENAVARLGGLRTFVDVEERQVVRLDVTLVRGEMRIQVRRNEEAPEAVLVAMDGAEVLVTRGDVHCYADGSWSVAALAGEGSARISRGGISGAPFTYAPGIMVGAGGQKPMGEREAAVVKARLPFSFEQVRAALPPQPAMGSDLEAP